MNGEGRVRDGGPNTAISRFRIANKRLDERKKFFGCRNPGICRILFQHAIVIKQVNPASFIVGGTDHRQKSPDDSPLNNLVRMDQRGRWHFNIKAIARSQRLDTVPDHDRLCNGLCMLECRFPSLRERERLLQC